MTPPVLVIRDGTTQYSVVIVSGRVMDWRDLCGVALSAGHGDRGVTWVNVIDWIVWCAVHSIEWRLVRGPDLQEFTYCFRGIVYEPSLTYRTSRRSSIATFSTARVDTAQRARAGHTPTPT